MEKLKKNFSLFITYETYMLKRKTKNCGSFQKKNQTD